MGHLVVAVFNDELRAEQAMSELRRWHRGRADFDNSLVITWRGTDLIAQQHINLSSTTGSAWGRLWGLFLRSALVHSESASIEDAVTNLQSGTSRLEEHTTTSVTIPESWWRTELVLPENFLRDVGALIQPGRSAFSYISRSSTTDAGSEITRGLGGTFLVTRLSPKQMLRLRTTIRSLADCGRPGSSEQTSRNK